MKSIIYTNKAPQPIGPYSQAVFCNGMLFCSGQIAADALHEDISVQTEKVCHNIQSIVEASGLRMEDIVKTTCFLATMDHFQKFNEVYERYFSHKPARSCVAAKELPKGALVEIEVLAVKE